MRSFSKVMSFSLFPCLFLILGLSGPVFAEEEVRTIGTMTASTGFTSDTFSVDGELKSLTVTLKIGADVPKDRFQPKEVYYNSPKTRVSSATVTVNGEKVFKPQDFNAQVTTLTYEIEDASSMTEVVVTADVDNDKDSYMVITINGVFQVDDVPGDEEVMWCLDRDHDTYGDPGICFERPIYDPPPDIINPFTNEVYTYVLNGDDCNDRDATIFPPCE